MDIRRKRKRTSVRFFKLADDVDLGPNFTRIPKYPGMAFLRFIVGWAFKHGYMPSDVYQQYLNNTKDFQLLAEYSNYEIRKQNEEKESGKGRN